jgi:hypothetical protein
MFSFHFKAFPPRNSVTLVGQGHIAGLPSWNRFLPARSKAVGASRGAARGGAYMRYDALTGVQDGGAAMTAYTEPIRSSTTPERKAEIETQLITYCRLDTFAMVRLWKFFSGSDLEIEVG